jgi:hypothetical protein
MDPNLLANIILLVCAAILGTALVYRYVKARRVGRAGIGVGRMETVQEVPRVRAEPQAPLQAPPQDSAATALRHIEPWERGRMSPREVDRLLDRVIEEDDRLVQSLSRELLEYVRKRGGFRGIRPQAMEAMATEFAILAAAFRRVSRGATGEPCAVTDEVRSALLKEAFRLVASQVGHD